MKNALITLLIALPLISNAQESATDSAHTSVIPPPSAFASEVPGMGLSHQELRYRSVTDIRSALDGQLAGVQFTNGGGQPGLAPELLVRGMQNLYSNAQPLILLNGQPYFGSVTALNPADIEQVSLLKNVSELSLYGNRSGNGILSITTKNQIRPKGNAIQLRVASGMATPQLPDYDKVSTAEFYELSWEGFRNYLIRGGQPPEHAGQLASSGLVGLLGGYNAYDVPDGQLIDPATGKINPAAKLRYSDNWVKEAQRRGFRQDYHLSASTVGEKGSVYLSTGYLNDQGFIRNTGFERFTAQLSADYRVFSWLTAGINASVQKSHQAAITSNNILSSVRLMGPAYPVYQYDPSGDAVYDANGGRIFDTSTGKPGTMVNSVRSLMEDERSDGLKALVLNPYWTFRLPGNIWLRSNVQWNGNNYDVRLLSNKMLQPHHTALQGYQKGNIIVGSQQAGWDQQFGQHQLNLSMAAEIFSSIVREGSERWTSGTIQRNTSKNDYRQFSYYGRLQYNFKSALFGSLNFRRDRPDIGGSQEPSFWAIGGGWDLRQSILKGQKNLKSLKLSANHGTLGIRGLNVNAFLWQNPMAGSYHSMRGNIRQSDASLDISLNDQKLDISIQAYDKKFSDGMYPLPLPNGGNSFVSGLDVRNRGLELALSATLLKSKNTFWNIGFIANHNKNTVTAIPSSIALLTARVGHSLVNFYVPEWAGVNERGQSEFYEYDNLGNKTATANRGNLDATSLVNAGSAFPWLTGSLSNSIGWKSLRLSFQLNYSVGGKYLDLVYMELMSGTPGTHMSTDLLRRWTAQNTRTDVPALDAIDGESVSTRFISNASWLNMRHISIAYTLNEQQLRRLKLSNCTLFVTAENLWLFTARRGMNPQADFSGNAGTGQYGPARTVMIGLQLGL